MENLRQTMIKTNVSSIVNGNFVRKEGFEPSYALSKLGKKISRTKIVGTVTNKFMSEDGNYSNITIQDDSGAIRVKAFGENSDIFDDVEIGEISMIIGKVKEYNDEIYISPEVIKKRDVNFENLHKLEVLKNKKVQKKTIEVIKSKMDKFADINEMKKYLTKKHKINENELDGIIENMTKNEEIKEKDQKPFLLNLIDKLDEEKGASIKKLLEESKLSKNVFEELMNEIINEGLCYEPKPGFIKRV